jgi:plastocyanin
MRLALPVLVLGVVLAGAACGGSDADQSATSTTTAKPSATSAAGRVEIDTFMFAPQALIVRVGQTVTWTNRDDILHTVTSGTREYERGNSGEVIASHKDGVFDQPLDGKGATATHTFAKSGTFHYFCDRHPGMEADVTVV